MNRPRHMRQAHAQPHGLHHGRHYMSRRLLLPAILLLLAEEPSHGYALRGRLEDIGVAEAHLPLPIIYRVLRRLEKEGLAVSDHVDQEGKGPSRKVFRLTDEGWEALASWSERIESMGRMIEEFQDRYKSLELEKREVNNDDTDK